MDLYRLLYDFLSSVKGNWRNAIFVECHDCPYTDSLCRGYLLTATCDCRPVLFSVNCFEELTSEPIIKEECTGVINRQAFENLYMKWLKWNIDNPKECSILQLIRRYNDM